MFSLENFRRKFKKVKGRIWLVRVRWVEYRWSRGIGRAFLVGGSLV